MIKILDKKDCCGCNACVQKCPKHCITMKEDKEGFLYPNVDENVCIDCHICEKVCPVLNQNMERMPLNVYVGKNPNEEIRIKSSSGGLFTMLAEQVIDDIGVVFGATFNEKWTVVHDYVETKEGLAKFRGSKYVQSNIGNSFKKAMDFLNEGRKVLFSGTPCQIAGLKNYLRKDYDNLITVDFICHGVPSPGVFRTYLQEEIDKKSARKGGGKNTVLHPCIPLITESDGLDCKGLEIESIAFRDKRNGWKKYGFALGLSKATAAGEKNSVSLSYTSLNKNSFLRGFLSDVFLRPSCYSCPVKKLKSKSDITLGDFWGIESLMPEIDDDKGLSAIVVNTERGHQLLKSIGDFDFKEVSWSFLCDKNSALMKSVLEPSQRRYFFDNDGKSFEQKKKKYCSQPISFKFLVLYMAKRICKLFRR